MLRLLTPNRPLALLMIAGVLLECGLLLACPDHIFTISGLTSVQAILILVCLWLHLTWGLWAGIRLVAFFNARLPSFLGWIVAALFNLAMLVIAVAHVASWRQHPVR